MINSKIKQFMIFAVETGVLVALILLAVVPFSCRLTAQGVQILGGDYTPPVLVDFVVVDENTVRLEFSESVEITGSVVALVLDDDFSSDVHSDTLDLSASLERVTGVYGSVPCDVIYDGDGEIVRFVLENKMIVGQGYELYTKVRDSIGNTLTLAVPFSGYNSRVPQLLITEIQSESVSSQKSEEKKLGTYRNEFVEILVLKGGNLAGIELCSGYDGISKKFDFPPIEVQTGEVFVVHMRKRGNGCISEIDSDITAAFSSYTSPEVRDLWTDIETTTIGNKTDILILRNRANNSLLDAVMYRASNVESWTKSMLEYSQLIDDGKIYESGDVENAFISDDLTATKTLARKNAKELQQRVLAGDIIDYPVLSDAESWQILSEPTPGTL